ncbi:hypothetical protein JCM11672_29630 [Alkaliphilus crotonatoxidans]
MAPKNISPLIPEKQSKYNIFKKTPPKKGVVPELPRKKISTSAFYTTLFVKVFNNPSDAVNLLPHGL